MSNSSTRQDSLPCNCHCVLFKVDRWFSDNQLAMCKKNKHSDDKSDAGHVCFWPASATKKPVLQIIHNVLAGTRQARIAHPLPAECYWRRPWYQTLLCLTQKTLHISILRDSPVFRLGSLSDTGPFSSFQKFNDWLTFLYREPTPDPYCPHRTISPWVIWRVLNQIYTWWSLSQQNLDLQIQALQSPRYRWLGTARLVPRILGG